jgi:hypothetical protein
MASRGLAIQVFLLALLTSLDFSDAQERRPQLALKMGADVQHGSLR